MRGSWLFRFMLILILMLIPIIFIGNNLYSGGRETLRKEISNAMDVRVNAAVEAMEKDIERMQLLQYEFLNDEFLNKLAVIPNYMNPYDKSRAIQLVQNQLYTLKNSSNYIANAVVYLPSISSIISGEQGTSKLKKEQIDALRLLTSDHPGQAFYVLDEIPYLVLVHEVVGLYEGENALYSIIVELSPSELRKSLLSLEGNENSGSLLLHANGDWVLRTQQYENEYLDQFIAEFQVGENELVGRGNITSVGDTADDRVLVSAQYSSFLDTLFIHYVPEKYIFTELHRYQKQFWILMLVFLVFIVVLFVSLYRMIHSPLLSLLKAFRKMEKGDLDISLASAKGDEFGYLFDGFNRMSRRLRELIDQVYTHQILAQRAELKQLQSQINPHFLYNSYFSLSNMIAIEDYDNAKRFASQMGSYLRYITRNSSDEVPLSEEAKHAAVYVEIQERRFRLRMQASFAAVPPAYQGVMVPRLILQPIIENTFNHVFDHIEEGGLLQVWMEEERVGEEEAGYLAINIADNGTSLTDEQLQQLQYKLQLTDTSIEMTGLLNVHRRLQLKYGEKGGIVLSRSAIGGLLVQMKIWKG